MHTHFLILSLLCLFPSSGATAAPFGNDIVYQIITDRFEDGDSGNNCGQNDQGLTSEQKVINQRTCDPSRKDWNRYWGGDFEGIQKRLGYLKSLGVTQLWISPIVENARGFAVGDGTLKTSYHGFWGRDWFRLNEHWTKKGTQDLDSFRNLVAAAKEQGLGVLVDTVANHTSPALDAEYGALYEDVKFRADALNFATSPGGSWFHPYPSIRWDLAEAPLDNAAKIGLLRDYIFQHLLRTGKVNVSERLAFDKKTATELQSYMLQNFMLADLADFDETNPKVAEYLTRAHEQWLDFGISGYRVDTARHLPQTYWRKCVDGLEKKSPGIKLVGEWYGGGPGNADSMAFIRSTGMTMFDFALRREFFDLFLKKKDLKKFAAFLQSSVDPAKGTDAAGDLVTFIDNHDMPRMQADGANGADVMQMLRLIFAVRGVPCIYYGLENFIYTKQEGGRDPYNRDAMVFTPEEKAPAQKLLKSLATLRQTFPELRSAVTRILVQQSEALVFERGERGKLRILVSRADQNGIPKSARKALAGFQELKLFESGKTEGKSAWQVRYFK